jgi:D-xylose transport system ATP-binding protein
VVGSEEIGSSSAPALGLLARRLLRKKWQDLNYFFERVEMTSQTPIVELIGITKSFGPVDVLKGIDFTAYAGRVTALVGDNGAGKSTLIKGLAGVQEYDGGVVKFEGKEVQLPSARAAAALGIEVVYQDLALCENLDIVQNMFLGREAMLGITLNEPQMEFEASKTLTGLSVRTVSSVRQKVASLSGGQRQTVAIARSVLRNAKLVILDEPTAALGVAQTEQVLNLVRRLADSGVAVIIISHNLQDVFKVADDIAVLYLGKMVANLKSSETNHIDVVQYITGSRTMGDQE